MHFQKLTVEKEDDPKGRTFTVHLVASLAASGLVPPPTSGAAIRPVLLAYAGSPSVIAAFTTNLRCGLPAQTDREKFELLRSFGYRYQVTSPAAGQSLAVAYLSNLFHLRPGAQDERSIRFVSAPPRWWLDEQVALLAPELGTAARDHARAMAFVARLDARSPLPIANDPRFHHALFERALAEGWTATPDDDRRLAANGLDALGLENPVLCDVSQEEFADFLAAATADLLPRFLGDGHALRPQLAGAAQLALGFHTA